MKRFYRLFKENPAWTRVILFSLALFFLRIADGIIAFWAPNQIQTALGNSMWMGLVISFQSVVGLLADLFFPSLLRNARTKTLLISAIVFSAATSAMFIGSIYFPYILLFLVAMAIWGIYYELISFAQYQFMGAGVLSHMRSGAWGVLNVFTSLAYFLGPLIAAAALLKGYAVTESVFLSFLVMGLTMLTFLNVGRDTPVTDNAAGRLSPLMELRHWGSLAKAIWPVIVVNMLIGFIDSTFWTTGAVWTEKLAGENFLGGLFLPFYQLPAVFAGLAIAKWGIYKGKKILSEKYLIVAGIFLMLMGLSGNIFWLLAMVLISAASLSVCFPLIEGVYSDLVSRMGHAKKDMIGLTNSTFNLAYIIWPPIAGFITNQIGERMTFSYLGLLVILVAVGLLFVTPKKLRLPQGEIQNW